MLNTDETFDLLGNGKHSLDALVSDAKKGDEFAKEKLIGMNAPLIKSIVKRYLNKGVEYDDLYQLGALGFVKAIINYDASFNVKFTTYAVPMIAGEIKRFLRDDGSIKVSRSLKHAAILIKNYINDYTRQHGSNPSLENISLALNIDINDVILAINANSNPLSLNEQAGEGNENLTLMDKISDSFSQENLIDKLALREMINSLNSREKQVILLRYYFDKTQTEIAKELGVSQVQISRIENKVIEKLREELITWVVGGIFINRVVYFVI